MKKLGLILLLAVSLWFLIAVSRLDNSRQALGKDQLETTLRRTAASCYALEGFYPPDVAYMQEHYGLHFDEEHYIIRYDLSVSNWMPDITVLERMP